MTIRTAFKRLVIFVSGLAAISVAAFLCWRELDQMGWIEHKRLTLVYLDHNWHEGESQQCIGGHGSAGELTFLSCSSSDIVEHGSKRLIPIRYWGRIDRPEHADEPLFDVKDGSLAATVWTCKRLHSHLTCWAK
jgi:hypothetical protein